MIKEHIKYFFPIKIYSREYYYGENNELYMKVIGIYFLGIPIYRKNFQKIKTFKNDKI